jgi:hypothetical protein
METHEIVNKLRREFMKLNLEMTLISSQKVVMQNLVCPKCHRLSGFQVPVVEVETAVKKVEPKGPNLDLAAIKHSASKAARALDALVEVCEREVKPKG